jgi:rhodanese-related sulfurtransferase
MSILNALFGGGSKADPKAIQALVADGAQLIDVRTPAEFSAGAIPGALNIPVQELQGRLDEVARDRPVVVYCRSGGRSGNAKRMLNAAGIEAVHDLGPMSAWPA